MPRESNISSSKSNSSKLIVDDWENGVKYGSCSS